ncbi:MAG: G1 family glutamic endopeptidase [Candidatus Limnocylindrales bacterium]
MRPRRLIFAGLALLLAPVLYVIAQPIAPAHQPVVSGPVVVRGAPASTSAAPTFAASRPAPTATTPPSASGATPSAAATTAAITGSTTAATDPSVAGYIVDGSAFQAVTGSWVVPAITCGAVQRRSVATWVGIEAASRVTTERVGVTSLCQGGHSVETFAWYQAAPAAVVRFPATVATGDVVTATVSVDGTTFMFSLADARTGAQAGASRSLPSAARDAVAWLVDSRPLGCLGSCTGIALADFGQTGFAAARATGSGRQGTIGEPLWSRAQVTMTTTSGAPRAHPSVLSGGGASFTVDWLGP